MLVSILRFERLQGRLVSLEATKVKKRICHGPTGVDVVHHNLVAGDAIAFPACDQHATDRAGWSEYSPVESAEHCVVNQGIVVDQGIVELGKDRRPRNGNARVLCGLHHADQETPTFRTRAVLGDAAIDSKCG